MEMTKSVLCNGNTVTVDNKYFVNGENGQLASGREANAMNIMYEVYLGSGSLKLNILDYKGGPWTLLSYLYHVIYLEAAAAGNGRNG